MLIIATKVNDQAQCSRQTQEAMHRTTTTATTTAATAAIAKLFKYPIFIYSVRETEVCDDRSECIEVYLVV